MWCLLLMFRGDDSFLQRSSWKIVLEIHYSLVTVFVTICRSPRSFKSEGKLRTRKKVIIISNQTIQVTKDCHLPNIHQSGVSGSNDMYTRTDTCCTGEH